MADRKVVSPSNLPTNRPSIGFGESAYMIIGSGKEANHKDVLLASGKALQEYQGFAMGSRTTFENFEQNISVRDQYTRQQYEYFRPSETLPKQPHDIIRTCRTVYRTVGLIRNIIDLMGDFCCQGIQVTHPNPRINKFFKGWAKKVRMQRTSERFANLFYREGVAVVKRTMGKISVYDEDKLRASADTGWMSELVPINTNAIPDFDAPLESDLERMPQGLQVKKRTIPLRYNFLNPLSLVAIGDELSQFVGRNYYALKISGKLRTMVMNPRNDIERRLLEMIPPELKSAIERGDAEVVLDPRKVRAYSYKRDDWQTWADPLIYAVLKDVILLEKMKLADLAALDGAITQVRLWKLGDLERGIIPTAAAIQRLASILLSNPGGGAFDLIWGPELQVEEYKTNVHQFLGKAKYEPVLEAIYSGLGIPPTLTGSASGGGFTNNYISLKTLIQRLEYGRQALREFWEGEIALVQQAMGFQRPARVEFDRMVLADEAAEKALLIQLADRDVISVDTLVERFGECPEFEEIKIRKERRAREAGQMNPKASPYHSPEQLFELVKVALQAGNLTPEQAGIDIPMDFADQEPPFITKLNSMEKIASMRGATAPGGKPGKAAATPHKGSPGRPLNSKDSGARKPKAVKPIGAHGEEMDSSAAFLTYMLWTKEVAQSKISDILTPALLQHYGKSSGRALSDEQAKQVEEIKFTVLANIDPFSDVTPEAVNAVLHSGAKLPAGYQNLYDALYRQVATNNQKEPTVDEVRTIQASVYALMNTDEEYFNGEDSDNG